MKFIICLSILAASIPVALGAWGNPPSLSFSQETRSHSESFAGPRTGAEAEPWALAVPESLSDLAVLQEDQPPPPRPRRREGPMPPRPGMGPGRRGRSMPPSPGFGPGRRGGPMMPPQILEKMKDLPPQEQEEVLRNNERFQELPKERQEQLLERLRRWQALTPEQREMIQRRADTFFNRFTPEQRQRAREIMPRWHALSEDRHKTMVEEFRKMRDWKPEEREKYLSGKDVESRFSPEERDLLKEINTYWGSLPPRPGPPPGRTPEPPPN